MRGSTLIFVAAMAAALSGCGGGGGAASSGVKSPSEVAGTWGADCATPFVRFDGGKMEVYPDKATYDLKSAALAGGQLTVAYDNAQGAVTETYVVEGDTLRLDRGTYGGTEAVWHKQPMKRCS